MHPGPGWTPSAAPPALLRDVLLALPAGLSEGGAHTASRVSVQPSTRALPTRRRRGHAGREQGMGGTPAASSHGTCCHFGTPGGAPASLHPLAPPAHRSENRRTVLDSPREPGPPPAASVPGGSEPACAALP